MDRTINISTTVADALRLVPAPACACDASGIVVAANDEMTALAGDALQGRLLFDLFDAAAASLAANELAAALHESRCWRGALVVDGEEIAVEVRARPLPAGCGAPGAIVLFTDVSAWERSQAALRTTVREQNAILEHAPVGIVFTKPGLLKECNPRLAQMIGYSVDELVDRDPGEMFAS